MEKQGYLVSTGGCRVSSFAKEMGSLVWSGKCAI